MRMRLCTSALLALSGLVLMTGCDDGDDDTGDAGMEDDGGNGGDGGGTNGDDDGGDNGDDDGGMMGECDLSGEGKEHEEIPNPTGTMTLTSDKVWELVDTTYVEDGDTLTIEPCTRIEGESSPEGTLVVARGGKIDAVGTPDEPILFTSKLPEGSRGAGNWGGVIILGRAENYAGTDTNIEGLTVQDINQHGGDDDEDDSGSMAYVRIEFGGFELMMGNEINGLTMGSVGSETDIHHIMVNTTQDDCFEWFGGTVNAHHLICNAVGDDMFDADTGYRGTLEYLFGRVITDEVSSDDPNGFEMDSDSAGEREPGTNVEVKYTTLCGAGEEISASAVSYGMVLRENLEGSISNIAVAGFDYGVDVRDDFGTPSSPNVELSDATFWDMRNETIRGEESGDEDNDDGFEEDEWFDMGDGNETPDESPFGIDDCLKEDGPASGVTESGLGAFADGVEDWDWDGMWISWKTE